MRIVVDIGPIDTNSSSAHKVRGVGKYITLLRDNLPKYDTANEYVFTANPSSETGDIVHYPYFDPYFITLPYFSKGKSVVTVHDVIPLAHKSEFPAGVKGEMKWRINKFLLMRSNAIITDSVASKKAINSVVGVDNEKIFPVYLSAEKQFQKMSLTAAKVDEYKSKFGLADKFVLSVGDVTWNKNLPKLTEAIIKGNTPLVMVGKALTDMNFDEKNPWNKDRLEVNKTIKDNKLFNALGYVSNEDLAVLYNLATALVMPSLDEGFGLPVLEAMQSGCAVISSRLGSLPEVGGKAAYYIDAQNSSDIAAGIEKVIHDNSLRSKLVEEGLLQAKKFSMEEMIKNTVNVYEKFIK